MSLLTPGLRQSIAKHWPCGMFVFIDHPDGEVCAWDGPRSFTTPAGHTGDSDFDGKTFSAVGPYGKVEGLGGSKQLRINVVTLVLSGLPEFAGEWLSPNIQGARAKVWECGLTERGDRLNGQPYSWIGDGACDYDELALTEGSAEIRLYIKPSIQSLETPLNPTYNPEWLNSTFGSGSPDARLKGLDKLHEVPTADIKWSLA